ncbi:MAG TPA: hypothetical protein PKH10_03715 [bacterium]|nr:hypothetical protein [bacterium]
MRRLGVAALLLVPLFFLYAGKKDTLKSDITVEPGVYKKGWERDFFRDLPPHDPPEESTDAVPVSPDADAMNHRRAVTAPRRMPTPTVTPEPVVEPAPGPATTNPEEKGLDDTPPPPHEERRAPRRPPEPVILPDLPPEEKTPPATGTPAADPEKKRKERLRELENKRKKGNFRDPKITY